MNPITVTIIIHLLGSFPGDSNTRGVKMLAGESLVVDFWQYDMGNSTLKPNYSWNLDSLLA
jgi:hypothetical protein